MDKDDFLHNIANQYIINSMKNNIIQVGAERTWNWIHEPQNIIRKDKLKKAYIEAQKELEYEQ